ncbi:hypothetical protein DBV15_06117 [Temnothorax longispinosus]|uniref:Uncharacterized protein n=1 Tax=Temnothorax longispinosus TaxID=300112 RepID=A0A4S2KE77_9HYME|nr:hypothetical protein DBV15_06117 [Temnothorax longispinosus]
MDVGVEGSFIGRDSKSLSVRKVNLGESLSRGVISFRSRSYIAFPTGATRRYARYNDGNDGGGDGGGDDGDDDVGTIDFVATDVAGNSSISQ